MCAKKASRSAKTLSLELNQDIDSNTEARGRRLMIKSKFMQSLDSQVYAELSRLAKERGVSVQELIRALIIPDWIRANNNQKVKRTR